MGIYCGRFFRRKVMKSDDNNHMMKTKSSGTGREAPTEGHSHPGLRGKTLSPAPSKMIPLFWNKILSAA